MKTIEEVSNFEPSYLKGSINDPDFVMPLKLDVTIPVYAHYMLVSAKFNARAWDIELQIDCPSVHGWKDRPICVGHVFVEDTKGAYTPMQAFHEAVRRVCGQNDKNWRPILARDPD